MRVLIPALACAALAAPGFSQHLIAYDPIGVMAEMQPPSPLLPIPGPLLPIYATPFALPMPAPYTVPLGDSTFDNTTGMSWYTNGTLLATSPSRTWSWLPPPPPIVINPAVTAQLNGPVTAIAYDPAANIMWMTSAAPVFLGVTPVAGTPIVAGPTAIPWPIGAVSGLEWDGMTNRLLAVDVGGTVYPFTPGGLAVGLAIPPPATFTPPAGDVAIDKTGTFKPGGVRPIYVSAGPQAFDVTAPAAPPFQVSPGPAEGLAFLPRPAEAPPGGGCVCGGFTSFATTTGPMTTGNITFGVTVAGVPPGNFVLFAFDFAFNPAFPMINATGCPFGLNLGSTTISTGTGVADPFGRATMALPLLVPPGTGPIYNQNATICGADPAGFVLTPMLQLYVCDL